MVWVCKDCGGMEKFKGYQNYTEYGTEDIVIDFNGEILDYGDRDSNDSERGDQTIEYCGKCESKNIEDVHGEELDNWKMNHFNANGEFCKEGKTKSENPGNFNSYDKLKLLNDELLSNKISIEEYRQKKKEIMEVKQ